jgi:SAM-dependent methyltransferase
MEGRKTFSSRSDAYASSRPQYPAELFAWIESQCQRHEAAWDCATGNGQAALGLAPHFDSVEATDISAEQLAHGFPASNVSYSRQPAEETTFPAANFDLVAVAQALHWFDLKPFWAEVRRTAKPGAFFCAWGYAWFECDPDLEALFFTRVRQILEPCWASQNGLLWRGYRSKEILFPFDRVEAPSFAIELNWDIDAIVRHVRTWSAYKRATADPTRAQLIARIEDEAVALFGSSGARSLKAPLVIAAGRAP